MKILVLVKETFDYETKIVLRDGTIDGSSIRFIINPCDGCAIEEALRLKECFGGEIVAISVGREDSEGTVRNALAMGVDRATLIISDHKDAINVSKILAENIKHENGFDIILSGWMALDDNKAEIPGRISERLGIPFINTVTSIKALGRSVICERIAYELLETSEVQLPALIAVADRINEPRLPTVIKILQASKAPLQKIFAPKGKSQDEAPIYELAAENRKGSIVKEAAPDEAAAYLINAIINEKVI